MAFGGNEIAPTTTIELIVASFLMVISSMFVAYIFGTMSDLISSMKAKQTQFEENLDTSNTSMSNLRLPERLCT